MTVDGIPCTTPTRMLLEAAGVLESTKLADLVDDAFCRGLSCVDAVEAALDRAGRQGRKGVALLTEVIAVWTPGIEPGSPAEMRLLRLVRGWGHGSPERQVNVYAPDGTFIGRLDLAWCEERVGLEYQRDRSHNGTRSGTATRPAHYR